LLEDPFNYKKYEKVQPGDHTLWQTTLVSNGESKQNFVGEKVITVIDSRQARLQKIITTLMSKFKSKEDAYVHLGYESVTLSADTAQTLGLDTDGKQAQMSGRKGLYVNADSVYDLLKKKTIEETKKRHSEMDSAEIEQIAHRVSVGTLRYEMIKQDLDKIIAFDLIKSLSLEGDTAPYIQYTYARASRIIEKSGKAPSIVVDFSLLSDKSELDLIKTIGLFDIHVLDAAKNLSPKVIARYCHDLAVTFNSFYEHNKVLDLGDEKLENSRLCLVNSFKLTLEKALGLLGIVPPDKM
ncbi:MAG: DALR anticodon-binding domain-containing protein, partial [Nitrosarchaeum sp.]